MRKITLSLAVIAMIGTAAHAEMKNESFGGSASLFYGTNDASGTDMFDKGPLLGDGASYGNAAINLNGVASVGSCDTCVKVNYGITGVSTLGLENTLVGTTWVNQAVNAIDSNPATPDVQDAVWIDTLNLSFNPLDGISNTTMVVGRQALATPMVFTETWNIAQNTYDAAVAVNSDITDTTLVGAWVGRSNVAGGSTVRARNIGDGFESFLTKEGAYAFGAVTKLIPTVTAQAWYYVAPNVANVTWAQAETEIAGLTLGGQFGNWDPESGDSGTGFGLKVGYGLGDLGLSAAYSTVEQGASFVNLGGAQTPLYTAGWWNVGDQGNGALDGATDDMVAYNVTATYGIKDVADLGLFYTGWDNGSATNEITVTAGKSIGNLDATLAYVYTDADGAPDTVNDLQAYFTYNF